MTDIKTKSRPNPITVTVVRSTEVIDLDAWLAGYARAIIAATVQPTARHGEAA